MVIFFFFKNTNYFNAHKEMEKDFKETDSDLYSKGITLGFTVEW